MKLVESEKIVRSRGMQQSTKCTIDITRKAFEALVGRTYKDSITAIIRELSANAIDAHRDAGTLGTPYLLKLPNDLDPNFSIRDFCYFWMH